MRIAILGLSPALVLGCGAAATSQRLPPPVPVGGPAEAMTPRSIVMPGPGRTATPAASQNATPSQGQPLRMRWLDVTIAGENLQIRAPEGAQVQKLGGVTTVAWGAGFSLEIRSSGDELSALEWQATNSPVRRLGAVLQRAPDALIYTTAEPDREDSVSFVAIRDLNGKRYACANSQGYGHDRALVAAMLTACRTLTPERGPSEGF